MPEDSRPPAQPGDEVSSYRIVGELGQGAMAVVYRATHLLTGRDVALKVQRIEGELDMSGHRRFLREVRMMSSLAHPHIVALLGAFEHEGRPWLVMELVEGESVRRMLRKHETFAPEAVRKHGEDLASALDHAHGRGILHQDVSPNNILMTAQREAKLSDFGLSRFSDAPISGRGGLSPARPASGYVERVGTPAYMSPEQIEGAPLDGRCDLFGLGASLYEMGTGSPAFSGSDQDEVFHAVLHQEPEPSLWPGDEISQRLRSIVGRALEKNPLNRYESAAAMMEDLRALGVRHG